MDPITIAAIINGAVQVGAAGIGSLIANQNRAKAEELMEARKQELKEWDAKEQASDFLNRADSQSVLRQVRQNQQEQAEAFNNDAIKTGATSQAKVAMAAKNNQQYASTVAQLAGIGAQHKDNVKRQYLQSTQGLDNLKIQNLMDTSGIDSTLQNLASTGNSIMQLYA